MALRPERNTVKVNIPAAIAKRRAGTAGQRNTAKNRRRCCGNQNVRETGRRRRGKAHAQQRAAEGGSHCGKYE